MKVVLKNDWNYLKISWIALAVVLGICFLLSKSSTAVIGGLVGGGLMAMFSLFSLDHQCGFQEYVRALPLSKYALLHGRYLEYGLMCAFLLLSTYVITGESLLYMVCYFGMISFFLPYGLSSKYNQYFSIIFLLLPLATYFPFVFGIKYFYPQTWALWENTIRLVFAAIGVMCFFISYFLARKIVEKYWGS